MRNTFPTNLILPLFTTALVSLSACSLVVDKGTTQCTQESDCLDFGGHPTCQQGVCVPSGLGPTDCFFGEPSTQAEFANQCTTARTFQFDNCARLGLCDAAALSSAMTVAAPPVNLGTTPPPAVTQPTPTVNCADVPNPIYITGSSNAVPLIKAVQPVLSAASPMYTAVMLPQGSCKGISAVYDPDVTKHIIKNITNNAAFYYNSAGVQTLCLLDAAGVTVDVGASDVYPASCGYSPTAGIADYIGPSQSIVMVVPSTSSQTTISAEAAHLAFAAGGMNGKTAPWNDPRYYFVRNSGSGTTQMLSRAITVDATKWWGVDRLSSSNLLASIEAVDPAFSENSIGILGSDFADKSRANVRVLAFQQAGQSYGYLPDSTPDALDKANVRDGHYPIWGALHFVAATTNGVPLPAASALITQFTVPRLEQTLVAATIEAGFIPTCAMRVNHTTEVGPLVAYQPPFVCGCYFDSRIGRAGTCQACTASSECPSSAPACNYGFCEKR
jgi:ABC-type phosphate transport system substrate-binding protein